MKNSIKGIISIAFASLSTMALADYVPPVEIEVTEARNDCYEDEFEVISTDDGYGNTVSVLEGLFSNMGAMADGSITTERKICQVRYNLQVPQGYKIVKMNFEAAGTFSAGERGNIRATIAHKVGNGPNRRASIQQRGEFSYVAGELSDLVSTDSFSNPIYGADLPPEFRRCGATIPVRTRLMIHASQSSLTGDFSEVFLDSADASASAKAGRVKTHPYRFCKIVIQKCY